jgi:hypothetical protein
MLAILSGEAIPTPVVVDPALTYQPVSTADPRADGPLRKIQEEMGVAEERYITQPAVNGRDEMNRLNGSRACNILACTFAAVLGCASSASADFTFDFPAGLACTFDLRIDGSGGNQIERDFFDKNGNLVRSIMAGTGSALTFTNVDTGATVSTKSNGAVSHVTYNSDGSSTSVLTDVPAGPSTTLYVGCVVFTADTSANFTLQGHSGTATNICAALS